MDGETAVDADCRRAARACEAVSCLLLLGVVGTFQVASLICEVAYLFGGTRQAVFDLPYMTVIVAMTMNAVCTIRCGIPWWRDSASIRRQDHGGSFRRLFAAARSVEPWKSEKRAIADMLLDMKGFHAWFSCGLVGGGWALPDAATSVSLVVGTVQQDVSPSAVALAIRTARRASRKTQEHLAAEALVNVRTVRRAEATGRVSDENIRSLCAVLGLDLEDMVTSSATEAVWVKLIRFAIGIPRRSVIVHGGTRWFMVSMALACASNMLCAYAVSRETARLELVVPSLMAPSLSDAIRMSTAELGRGDMFLACALWSLAVFWLFWRALEKRNRLQSPVKFAAYAGVTCLLGLILFVPIVTLDANRRAGAEDIIHAADFAALRANVSVNGSGEAVRQAMLRDYAIRKARFGPAPIF